MSVRTLIDKPFKSLEKEDEVIIGDEDEINADVTANFDLPENDFINIFINRGIFYYDSSPKRMA